MTKRSELGEFDREQRRATWRDVVPPTVALVVANGVQESFDLDADEHAWHVAIGLLPLLPALWLAWAVWRSYRRSDEFQRLVHLHAMAAGFAAMILVASVGSLLESSGLDISRAVLQWTYIAGMLVWGGTLGVQSRSRP